MARSTYAADPYTRDFVDHFFGTVVDADGMHLMEEFQEETVRFHNSGSFDAEKIDAETLIEEFCQRDQSFSDLIECIRYYDKTKGRLPSFHLVENMDAIKSGQFDKLLSTVINVGALETRDHADFGLIDCVRQIDVDCNRATITDLPKIPDLADESKEEELTQYYGLDTPDCVDIPEPGKRKFAFAITREFVCRDPNGQLQNVLRQGEEALMMRKEKLIADYLINGYPIGSNGRPIVRVPFLYNGQRISPYQWIGGGGPFENYVEGTLSGENALPCISRCDLDVFCVIEELEECRLDPNTCEPLQCEGDLQIAVAMRKTAMFAQQLLGNASIERENTGDAKCPEKFTFTRGNREGWDQNIKTSKYMRERLIKWYQQNCGLSREMAKKYAAKFWVAGRFQQALAWATEWDTEVLERQGRDTVEYWDQEIIWSIKYLTKSGLAVMRPDQLYHFKAVPDKAG